MKIKGLLIWNTALTILLIGIFINGCTAYDPRYDELVDFTNENREIIVKAAKLLDDINAENRERIQENREYISENRELIIKNSEALSESNNSLEQIITILKLAALF